jgi:hypothetical protein
MLQRCPHCHQRLQPQRFGVPFGPMALRIIDAVDRAGPAGISTLALFAEVYAGRTGTVERLKTYIGTINSALAGKGVALRIDRASDIVTVRRA